MSFTLNKNKDLGFSCVLFILASIYISFSVFSENQSPYMEVLVSLALLAFCAAFGASYFAVRTILVSEDSLVIKPINIRVKRSEVHSAEITWSEFYEQRGELNKVNLVMKSRRLAWVPFSFIWIGNRASIRVVGIDKPKEFLFFFDELKYQEGK